MRIISLKHVQDANVCGEARLSGVPFLGSSVCLWVGHELIPRPALFQFRKPLRQRKIKMLNEQSVFLLFSSDKCGCQID